MSVHCIKALINGRVQGVFFRESTRQQAIQLNISGHAINLSDGRVEVIACGEKNHIDKLITWLHSGPDYARVDNVDIKQIETFLVTGFSTG